jgi:hypothetical protein
MMALQSSMSAGLFLEAPDIYYAAAVLAQGEFFEGRGDRAAIITLIISNGGAYPAIKDKLMLIQMGTFYNVKLFKDDFAKHGYPARFGINKHRSYQLWLSLVRQKHVLSNADYIAAMPD